MDLPKYKHQIAKLYFQSQIPVYDLGVFSPLLLQDNQRIAQGLALLQPAPKRKRM